MNLKRIEELKLGAWVGRTGGIFFRLWAPNAKTVEVIWYGDANGSQVSAQNAANAVVISLSEEERGYFSGSYGDGAEGGRYKFRLDGKDELPDPTSRYQPEGPHGPSQVVSQDFEWTDAGWAGVPLEDLVIYELHVGTFTQESTFSGIEAHLPRLRDLGITAIELMPVAQFAGARNWGYDGVGLFAAQNTYGGDQVAPLALKRLINACHSEGIAVILDVVYNHLGPEGNYLSKFGPYFQNKYKTPWGEALNYDGSGSDEVRHYFLQNARQWLEEFHFDGLRLDAVHAIFDTSAQPFLEDLARLKTHLQEKAGRPLYLIAESDANDARILRSYDEGGHGMDAHWADDLHHVVHSLFTGENRGYYADYGGVKQLATVYREGVLFQGEYSPYRLRSHGRKYSEVERSRLVVCSQNHDQIGNRMKGERLISLVGSAKQRLATACILLSPAMPLIFMGEEIAETAPFLYFVDHTDPGLLEAVRQGRKAEFADFTWQGEPPDPAAPQTFELSRVNWQKPSSLAQDFTDYYRRLITLSKWIRKNRLMGPGRVQTEVGDGDCWLRVQGESEDERLVVYYSFSAKTQMLRLRELSLEIILDSSENTSLDEAALEKGQIQLAPFSVIALRGPKE